MVLLMVWAFLPRSLFAGLALALSTAGILYVALDPGWLLADRISDTVFSHFQRGQEADEALPPSPAGRNLWEVIWRDFRPRRSSATATS